MVRIAYYIFLILYLEIFTQMTYKCVLILFILQSKLESMLIMPNTVAVPQIGYLKNPVHLSKVRRQSNEVISAVYKQIYEHVYNPNNEYDDPSALMPRTPDLVYQILVNDEKPS